MTVVNEVKLYRTLLESIDLNEAYEDRVRQVSQKIKHDFRAGPVDKNSLMQAIEHYAADVPLGSLSVKEFAKDVMKELGNQISVKHAIGNRTPNIDRIKLLQNAVKMVMRSLENITDGVEPYDYIFDNHRRYGFTDDRYSDSKLSDSRDFKLWMNLASMAILKGDEHGNTDILSKYVSPAAMSAAQRNNAYSKLVDIDTKAFVDEHPDLAKQLGYAA